MVTDAASEEVAPTVLVRNMELEPIGEEGAVYGPAGNVDVEAAPGVPSSAIDGPVASEILKVEARGVGGAGEG